MTPVEPNPIAPRTVGISPIPAAPAAEEPTAAAATPPVRVEGEVVSFESLLFCFCFCFYFYYFSGGIGERT